MLTVLLISKPLLQRLLQKQEAMTKMPQRKMKSTTLWTSMTTRKNIKPSLTVQNSKLSRKPSRMQKLLKNNKKLTNFKKHLVKLKTIRNF